MKFEHYEHELAFGCLFMTSVDCHRCCIQSGLLCIVLVSFVCWGTLSSLYSTLLCRGASPAKTHIIYANYFRV